VRIPGSDWIQNLRELTAVPQPSGRSARESMALAIVTGDPEILLFGFSDVNLPLGHEQDIRQIIIPYSYLPREKFDVALGTGVQTNLAVRQLNREDDAWLYLVNPGFWPFEGSVSFTCGGEVTSVPDGEQVAGAGAHTLPITVEPFGIRVFRCASPELSVTAYETGDLDSPEIRYLEGFAERAEAKLAALDAETAAHVEAQLADLEEALEAGEYAGAWYIIKKPRFWNALK
jgi:hypothetical protein